MKGTSRNKPCECGSGKKGKKCCGKPESGTAYRERLAQEQKNRDEYVAHRINDSIDSKRKHGRKRMTPMQQMLMVQAAIGVW